jgi:hypothetical protein
LDGVSVIREDRDCTFWQEVYEHPAVKEAASMGHEVDVAALLAAPCVHPLRGANGGFLFVQLDGTGRIWEFHTAFKPEGWGREVATALKHAIQWAFDRGGQLVTTYEVEGNWRSQPPRSFRFKACGDFEPAEGFTQRFRTWALTKPDWRASPAFQRM